MEEQVEAKVVISFHSSSTKGGSEAYKVSVTDQAMTEDVERAIANAIYARDECLKALNGQKEEVES